MGQFEQSYQPGFNNYSQNDGFSSSTDPSETPLGSGAPQGGGANPGFASGPSSFVPSAVFSGAATNPNPTGAQNNQAGPNNIPPPQNQNSFGNPGWKPTYSAPGGYNPMQYADDNTANQLAQGLGGTVERTKTLGPFGDFGQNQINFGNGNQLNAGLLADRYTKYDRATADAMTAAEKNAGPAVTNPNAGAVYLTGNPMINPSQTPGYHPPGAPAHNPAQNPLLNPGTNPQGTGPQPGAGQQPGGGQQNQLMQLLQLLGLGGGQLQAQNRQPYANSGYYPNLPRGGNQMNPLTPSLQGTGQFQSIGAQAVQRGAGGQPGIALPPMPQEYVTARDNFNNYRNDMFKRFAPAGWNSATSQGNEPWMQQAGASLTADPEYKRLQAEMSRTNPEWNRTVNNLNSRPVGTRQVPMPQGGPNPMNTYSDWRNSPEQNALNAYVQSRGPNPYQPAGYDPMAMQSQEVKPWQQKYNDELNQDPEYRRLYNAANPQNGALPNQRPSTSTPQPQNQGLSQNNVQQQLLSLLLGF